MAKGPTAPQTANGPMAIAACEQHFAVSQRLVNDDLAFHFLPRGGRLIVRLCRWGAARRALIGIAEKISPGTWAGIACRKRYMDEKTADAIAAGIGTVVVLGAGLDTLACRVAASKHVRAFEVDLPVNIEAKRARMRELWGGTPEGVTLVPVDFEIDDAGAALAKSGFRIEMPAMFVWEGVTQYLTEAGVRKTLAFLSQAAAGSRLAFTYVLKDFIEGKQFYGAESIYKRSVEGGVWHFGIAPEAVGELLREYGWAEREQAGRAEFAERYVAPAGRELPVFSIEPCVYAEKA
jgi:methyltransferase (TIGR00027 family)